ncbi:hypothetical protein [Streptomyces sp. NPDC059564]|uniref:hypothetical protein n=1 Tax=Streptomyces sp. NPDC059564 TaxID=3346865 RepID=UPI0036C1B5E3
MRRGRGHRIPVMWALATATAAVTATGCSHPLADLGPLPPRYTGPVLSADTVVADLTAALAAEGVTARRTPPDVNGTECHESLSAEPLATVADSAVRAAFARARSTYGWQDARSPQEGTLSLSKGNWTAMTTPNAPVRADQTTAQVMITLVCDGRRATPSPSATAP